MLAMATSSLLACAPAGRERESEAGWTGEGQQAGTHTQTYIVGCIITNKHTYVLAYTHIHVYIHQLDAHIPEYTHR